jgi:hypothetical protein
MGQIMNEALTSIVKGEIDFLNDDIVVLLTTGAANIDSTTYISDITGELSGGGYARKTLASKTVTTDDTNDRVIADAADVSWTGLSGTFRYIHVAQSTGNDATSRVLSTIDLGSNQTIDNGTYDINWTASGVFYIQNPA